MRSLCLAFVLTLLLSHSAQCHQPALALSAGNPEPPATLVRGLGSHHHSVSTASADAQKFFDQGLTLVYAFNHPEAVRSFERAAQFDPRMTMAYWGIALALGSNINSEIDSEREKAAYEAIQKARARAATGPEQERLYVAALAKRYSILPQADRKALNVDYKNAMGELVRRYPDDLDAATLFAEAAMVLRPWRLWTADGKPEDGTLEIVAVLESVLRRDPNHIGAIHYYIHAVEASSHPERALVYAVKLPALVPAAGHLVHMPAHIYERTGDYMSASRSNRDAAQVDEAYVAARGVEGPSALMYYSHNLHFLAVAESMAGRLTDSLGAARKLEDHVAPHLKAMPVVEIFMPTSTLILARFRRWDAVLKLAMPEASLAAAVTYWHFARGIAFSATGDVPRAEQEHRDFLRAEKGITSEMASAGGVLSETVRRVADHVMSARIARAKGDAKSEIELLRKGVEIEDSVGYDEPPAWHLPTRESLGGALLRNGHYAEAERVFRADLERNRRNGRSLFGLMGALTSQNRLYEAALVRQEFESAWRHADTPLRLEDL
jgi:tetratricopeptide (TPR) repeat protein